MATHTDGPPSARADILIVDDLPVNLLALEAVLHDLGEQLVRANSGEEALRLVLERDFAVILLDVQMAGLDGFETAQLIRSRKRSRHTPIIFLTAHESPIFPVSRAYALGAVDFLVKPIVPDILRAKVAVFVDLFRKTEEVKRQAEQLRVMEQREFERRLAEESLRRSEERFRLVADSAPVLLWLADAEGRCTFFNRQWLDFTGRTLEAEVGDGWIDGVHADDRARCLEIHRGAVQARRCYRVEYRLRRADGEFRWVLDSASPRFENGSFAGHVGSVIDITDRKHLEEQFLQSQKLEAIGRLAGGVAHDFNNLMTIVTGYSEMLLQSFTGDDRTRDLVEPIKEAGDRAAGLTRQLLAFGRKQLLTPRVLDLNGVVSATTAMLRRLIRADIQLELSLEPQLCRVRADPTQLEQVILNLAINARDAMPEGGTLTLATAMIERGESANGPSDLPPGTYAQLTVADSGCGMDEHTQSHLFEPFYTTKGIGKGTGLGLATVYGIVKQSGGTIDVHSAPGRGTRMDVYLPCVEDRASPAASGPQAAAGARGSEVVLVVEDEDVVRRLVRRILRQKGYTVLEACRGEEGLGVAEQHPGALDLLVTDVVMPGMGGRELAQQLTERWPAMKVLYVSGYAEDAVFAQPPEKGTAFLSKPFPPESLARKVREVLDGV